MKLNEFYEKVEEIRGKFLQLYEQHTGYTRYLYDSMDKANGRSGNGAHYELLHASLYMLIEDIKKPDPITAIEEYSQIPLLYKTALRHFENMLLDCCSDEYQDIYKENKNISNLET